MEPGELVNINENYLRANIQRIQNTEGQVVLLENFEGDINHIAWQITTINQNTANLRAFVQLLGEQVNRPIFLEVVPRQNLIPNNYEAE